jgi:superfamily II DNA/RNA helicase
MRFSSLIVLAHCALTSSFSLNFSVRSRSKSSASAHSIHRATNLFATSADDALEQTKKHLEKLSAASEFAQDEDVLYKQFIMKPANVLKEELKSLKLKTQGRKPDLARRLVTHYIERKDDDSEPDYPEPDDSESDEELEPVVPQWQNVDDLEDVTPLRKFAKLPISITAGTALARAGFTKPTPIQKSALPLLSKDGESLILHAETGSGKTLCYLLPITEKLWREDEDSNIFDGEGQGPTYALILTPTRELAAQVAGVATCLAPPGSVRLITTPTNLVRDTYEDGEKSEGEFGGRLDNVLGGRKGTKIIVGSAKSVLLSLFGDSKLHPPTSKPEAKKFMSNVNYIVLDEVDRLLNIKTTRGKTSKHFKKHDKPAAILSSTITKFTLGQAQIVAASATVGRPLRRELARVLGLAPDECPRVVRASGSVDSETTRLVSTPLSLKHYAMPCDGSTSGGILTTAALLTKGLSKIDGRGRRTLFVITKGCGIQIKDAIGALKHFNVQPQPKALGDVLEADGTDRLMEAYRQVSGAGGLGERSAKVSYDESEGYVLVTGEDTVRGMHLDELDTVVVAGRPKTPDEYIHIAGRAGRAGKPGSVVNILSYDQASALKSWESMLGISFIPIDESDTGII